MNLSRLIRKYPNRVGIRTSASLVLRCRIENPSEETPLLLKINILRSQLSLHER